MSAFNGLAWLLACSFSLLTGIDFGQPVLVTQIMSRQIAEASGLANSLRSDDYYWIINDSQNGAELFAVDRRGNNLGTTRVLGVENIDWESLDAVSFEGRNYLVIGDVGDNNAIRPEILLHFVEEPEPGAQTVDLAWTLTLRLPTGPTDIEAIFADAQSGHVYLLTKRQHPPHLWRVPIAARGTVDAEWRARVETIPQPTAADLREDPKLGPTRSQVTGIDTLPDGSGIVLLTYRDAYFYPRRAGKSWAEALSGTPRTIPMPRTAKPEALTFTRDGRALLFTSEHWPAPLVEIRVSHD